MLPFSDVMLFFATYSLLGWVMESIFVSIYEKKLINRGFLTGFFCPIYGFGAVMILFCFQMVNKVFRGNDYVAVALSITASVVLATILEYVTGYLLEKIFHNKWWDYSDHRFNLRGYICLQNSLFWGILAFLLVKFVNPVIAAGINSIPASAKSYIAILLLIYFTVDTAKSVAGTLDLREVILHHSMFSAAAYYDKIQEYKRVFLAFPELLKLNAGIINRDIRSIVNDRFGKIKMELKSRMQ